jgi:CheY-like chemotaxis protein
MVAKTFRHYELLLADDDAEFRRTLRLVLEPLDMHMRSLSGLDTLRVVKSMRAALPCIIITASPTDELRRTAALADVFTVLKKPVSRRLLLRTVSQALELAYDDPDVAGWLTRRQ